ncbi:uncharacterized protein [Bemisia tabaci]|uniref:uncharacterized protein n=1 Tax=Bemisia tabaci TaxID=7038 RepID=UPI003B27D83B
MAVGLLSKAFLTFAALVLLHHAARAMPPGGRSFRLEMDEPNMAEPNTGEPNTGEPNTAEPNMDEGKDDLPIMDGANMDEPNRGDLGTGDKTETHVARLTTRAPNPTTNTGDKQSWGSKILGGTLKKTLTKLKSSRISRQKSILNAPSKKDLKESDAKLKEIQRKVSTRKRTSSSVSSVGSFSGGKSFGGGSFDETSSGGFRSPDEKSRGRSPDRSRSPDEKSTGRSPNKPRSPIKKSYRGKGDYQDGVSFPTSDLAKAKKRVPPKSSSFKEEGNTGKDEAGEIDVSVVTV